MMKANARRFLRLWAAVGASALAALVAWGGFAYAPNAAGRAALQTTANVKVERHRSYWAFVPAGENPNPPAGLLFFPGALVEPAAYAPYAKELAAAGYLVVLVDVPWRGALGGADGPEVLERAKSAARAYSGIQHWVAAGHSRGAAIAARLVHEGTVGVSGLVLIGSSHPRAFSLASSGVAVTKVYATRDGVAKVAEVERHRNKLPASTRWVRIEGGNHSQFGWYGFQPGDSTARIPREQQQEITLQALRTSLEVATGQPKRERNIDQRD